MKRRIDSDAVWRTVEVVVAARAKVFLIDMILDEIARLR
jgi:hypothetical protein